MLQAWNEEQGDVSKAVYYGTLALRFNRYQEDALATLLTMFKNDSSTTTEQIFGFLAGLYHFENLKDKLFVLKAAMKIGYKELEEQVRQCLAEKELEWLNETTNETRMEFLKQMGQKIQKAPKGKVGNIS